MDFLKKKYCEKCNEYTLHIRVEKSIYDYLYNDQDKESNYSWECMVCSNEIEEEEDKNGQTSNNDF